MESGGSKESPSQKKADFARKKEKHWASTRKASRESKVVKAANVIGKREEKRSGDNGVQDLDTHATTSGLKGCWGGKKGALGGATGGREGRLKFREKRLGKEGRNAHTCFHGPKSGRSRKRRGY